MVLRESDGLMKETFYYRVFGPDVNQTWQFDTYAKAWEFAEARYRDGHGLHFVEPICKTND